MLYSWRETMKVLHIGISGIALVSLIGCSSRGLGSKRVDYRSGAVQAPSLEVPPDLTAPGTDERYKIPQGSGESAATFSDYRKGGAGCWGRRGGGGEGGRRGGGGKKKRGGRKPAPRSRKAASVTGSVRYSTV